MAITAAGDQPQRLGWALSLSLDTDKVILQPLQTSSAGGEPQSHWYLDFVVDSNDTNTASTVIQVSRDDLVEKNHSSFFTTDLSNALSAGKSNGTTTVLRLVFSRSSGTPARSDFIEYRFDGCEHAHTVRTFMKPLTPVAAIPESRIQDVNSVQTLVEDLLSHTIGGIIGQSVTTDTTEDGDPTAKLRQKLDESVAFRLSVPYLLPDATPPPRRRVFWVQGRTNIVSSIQFYQAAHALGLDIVVVDAPGHWMEDPQGPHAHYREAFIPLDIDPDQGLPQRIVDAVRAYPHPVHGIVTISDSRLPQVAQACEALGLPTESPEAYRIAGDKGETRTLEMGGDGKGESFVLSSAEHLDPILEKYTEDILDEPLVVKPCTGWNSDCVVKVKTVEELRAAVQRASDRHKDSKARNTRVVVEPYIDGPEVDADFVMLNGEVLFSHITDDFPCSGDLMQGGTMSANFMETMMDIPSALPEDEKAILRESLAKSIKRCGFTSGVFHCEARVRHSRAYYKPRDDNGILDLHIRETNETKKSPSCYLHEINARSPGYANCVVSLLLSGVDYYAVRLLVSLGPSEDNRIRVLSQPFLYGKPQYTSGIAVLPPSRLGVMAADDAIAEFLEANPDLRPHVPYYQTIKERGDLVQGPDASELWMVGFVVVVSRKGRKEWLELAQQVRDRFDYRVE